MSVRSARELCQSLLAADLPRRWAHSQGVARRAGEVGHALGEDAATVETAAWLHDIGYAPALVTSGFHPLDGARYLRDTAFSDRALWALVAHHSAAMIEAAERDLDRALATEFPIDDAPQLLLAALTYCDMTTGPDGQAVDADKRITEILTRYPSDHVVHRSISRAAPELRSQVDEIGALLATT